jgi:hypothetical protein
VCYAELFQHVGREIEATPITQHLICVVSVVTCAYRSYARILLNRPLLRAS